MQVELAAAISCFFKFILQLQIFNHGGIMNIKKSLILAALTISAGTSHAWNLVYAHDASGNPTGGSLQTLRTALNNGSNLRVLVIVPNVHTWSLNCHQFSIKHDASQAVVCQNDQGLAGNINLGAHFGAPPNPTSSAHFILNTLGQYSATSISRANGSVIQSSVSNHQMQWYVD